MGESRGNPIVVLLSESLLLDIQPHSVHSTGLHCGRLRNSRRDDTSASCSTGRMCPHEALGWILQMNALQIPPDVRSQHQVVEFTDAVESGYRLCQHSAHERWRTTERCQG
jgi:hypothetical protein